MNLLSATKKNITKEPTQEEMVLNFLKMQNSGVLATVDPNNNPHAAVIYYSADPSYAIRFLTKKRTKKSDNLDHNNHAMFVVYDEILQTVVQITGKVSEISDENEAHEVFMNALRASLQTASNAIPPVSKVKAGEHVAYKLVPVELKMAVYNRHRSAPKDQRFRTIHLSF